MFENYNQDYFNGLIIDAAEKKGLSVVEGSLIYNSATAIATMLEDCMLTLEEAWENCWADTCDRESLIRFAQMRGLEPYPGTSTTVTIASTGDIEEGALLSDGVMNWVVYVDDDKTIAIAEDEGEYVIEEGAELTQNGEVVATVVSIVSVGTEAEDTEDFRDRYFGSFVLGGQFGNEQYYIDRALDLAEVKNAFVTAFTADNTVVLEIVPSGIATAEETKALVEAHIHPSLGHQLEVVIATRKRNVTITITGAKVAEGYTESDVIAELTRIANDYINEVNGTYTVDGKITFVRSKLLSRLFAYEGITDGVLASPTGNDVAENGYTYELNGGTVNVTFS